MGSMLQSKIISKGQVIIPLSIKDSLGLEVGSKIEFFNKGDHFTFIPLNKSVISLKGILSKPEKALSCNEMDEVIRQNS